MFAMTGKYDKRPMVIMIICMTAKTSQGKISFGLLFFDAAIKSGMVTEIKTAFAIIPAIEV
jgi:hypothetical protein